MKLQINNLSIYFKSKDGTRKILDLVNLELNSGLHLLCGENGTGKSSLLKTIAGTVKPAKGEIVLPGESKVFLNSNLGKYKKIKVSKYFKKLCIKRKFLPSERFIDDVQRLFEINEIWNKSIKDLSKEEVDIVSLLDLVFEDYDVVLLDEVFSSMEISLSNKILSFIYGHYKDKIIILIDHQNRLKIEPNYYLYLKDYNIVLEEKNQGECFLVNSESIVSKKCELSFVRKKYEELKTSIPLYFITAIFIMISLILPLVTNHINSSKLKNINYLPCVTLYNPSDEVKKSLADKRQFHLPSGEAQEYLLEKYVLINDGVTIDTTMPLEVSIKPSLDDYEFESSNEYDNYVTIKVGFVYGDNTYEMLNNIYDLIYYQHPKVKCNRIPPDSDKRLINLSCFLFDTIFSSCYFADRVQVYGVKKDFDGALIYFSEESKVISNVKALKEVSFIDKVDEQVTTVDLTYDENLEYNHMGLKNVVAFSTGFILEYFEQKEFSTYYFDSDKEYKEIISKSKNTSITTNYSAYIANREQIFKQGIYFYFLNYFLFSGIVLMTKPKWSKEKNLISLAEVSGVFYAISFVILLICRAFYAALLSLMLLLAIALAILHSYKKKKMVGSKNV